MKQDFVLDDTLRHLYIAVRNKGARLLAIRFIHRGKKWEADTAKEAVRLRRELEEWDREDAELGTGEPIDQYIRAESVWTPDTFWNFVHNVGSQQRKAVIAMLENKHYWSHHLAEAIGIEEESLGGVLSGLSKQLKQLSLRTSDLYQVHTDWSGNERKRLFYIQPAFRLAAEEVGWPDPIRGSETSTLCSPTTKLAPLKSRGGTTIRVASSTKQTKSTWLIDPVKWSSAPLSYTVSLKTVLDFFHISNLKNASLEEAIYLHTLYSHLLTQARLLAAILPWSLQRPLQALRAAMNEPGRNYSARNAKRKRPSNSPASSRKRSSGG